MLGLWVRKTEFFARSEVQFLCDVLNILVRDVIEVWFLGDILADKFVDVFNSVFLPGVIAVGKAKRQRRWPKGQRRRKTCRVGSHRLAAFEACGERTLLEHRTDGTDAFDTLWIGSEKFPYRDAFLSMFRGLFDIYLLGIPAPPSGYRFSAFICVTTTMFWRLKEK